MSILKLIGSFLLDAVKAFFGTDKPVEHEVKDAKAHPAVVSDDASLIAELRAANRSTSEDGSGSSPSGASSANSREQDNPLDPT